MNNPILEKTIKALQEILAIVEDDTTHTEYGEWLAALVPNVSDEERLAKIQEITTKCLVGLNAAGNRGRCLECHHERGSKDFRGGYPCKDGHFYAKTTEFESDEWYTEWFAHNDRMKNNVRAKTAVDYSNSDNVLEKTL